MAAVTWEMDSGIIIAVVCFLSVVVSCITTVIYSLNYKVPTEHLFEKRPSLVLLYIKGLAVALFHRRDVLELKGQTSESQPVKDRRNKVTVLDCRIDISNLEKYYKVCEIPQQPRNIPPCYLETYFLPLLISVIASKDFKLSPLGLIHIRQTITQHASLQHLLKEPFDLECIVLEYRPTGRGVEVDAGMKVYDRREMCLWEGVATFLSRNSDSRKSGSKGHRTSAAVCVENGRQGVTETPTNGHVGNGVSYSVPDEEETVLERTVLKLPADLGVQYAKVSGDWNPHHLWSCTARLLGYKDPIAHGMWSMARCLEWLDTTGKFSSLPPFHVDVQFKRPMFLPGSSVFSCFRQIDKKKHSFRVHDEATGAPQLIGCAQRL